MRRIYQAIAVVFLVSTLFAGCSVLAGLDGPEDIVDAGTETEPEPAPEPEREPAEDLDDPDEPLWDGGAYQDAGNLWNGRCQDAGKEIECPFI